MHRPAVSRTLAPALWTAALWAASAPLHALDADPSDDTPARVVQAVEEGRYADARALLDDLLCRELVARARALIEAGNPQDGLLAVDRALTYQPDDAAARLLRAEGALLLAEAAAARGAGALFVEGAFQDALAAFREVPPGDPALGPRVLFGASRAAYQLGRGAEALDFARQGMELVAGGPEATGLPTPPERTWAEASFLAYRDARGADAAVDVTAALFRETEGALERLLARTPEDAWVWSTFARLYQWEGDGARAAARLQQGLDHLPTDAPLLATLVEIAGADGAGATIEELDRFLGRHPDVPEGHWHRGLARFDAAVSMLLDGEPAAEEFPSAETDFARCRALQPEYELACRGYEVMCRNALGWTHYNAGELDAARDAFLSTVDVLENGLAWEIEGRLLSGIQGLEFVAQAHNEAEDWGAAADVFELLRQHEPEEAKWANNAGFFQRDAAVSLELVGRRLCQAAAGDALSAELAAELARLHAGFGATPAECAALADEYLTQARERMRKSYAAYLEASRLAPDDVRVVNDTALVVVYYLHDDLDRAEEILRRCIAMGAEQVKDEGLSDEDRFDLENAWGDAFQNLGVLYLAQRRDPEKARSLFERSLDLGDSRPFVRERLLPLCDATPEEVAAAEEQGLRAWAVPCR